MGLAKHQFSSNIFLPFSVSGVLFSRDIFIKCITEEQQGFSQNFYLECGSCTWCDEFYYSAGLVFPGKNAWSKKPFETNVRSVIALQFKKLEKEMKQCMHLRQ